MDAPSVHTAAPPPWRGFLSPWMTPAKNKPHSEWGISGAPRGSGTHAITTPTIPRPGGQVPASNPVGPGLPNTHE